MKASILVTNVVNFWLRLITKRNRTSRFFSSANLAFFPFTSLEDETSIVGGLYCSDNNSPTNGDCISAEFGKQGNKSAVSFHEFTNQYISVFNYQKADDVEMERVRYILTKHGWNFTNYDGHGVNLDEDNVINALNNLFKETANATLVLCFFKWLEYSAGLKHTIRSFCTMICILASGNMNYRVMDLLKNLVQDHHGEDGWHDLLLSSLQEICKGGSVLVTLYSMLVQCYVETNMTNVAVKLVYQMEHSGVFPKAWVCNSLLRALLDSNQEEVAWDLLETMHGRGMINSSFISLFIYYYCSKGNIECGWKLLTDMRNYEIKPDVVSYGIVIHFLCKVCFLKEANSLLFKMIQMGLSPDSVLLSSIIDGYCKVARPEGAISIAKFFNVLPNIFVCNSFISMFCNDGLMVQASNIFHVMSELGFLPDCYIYTTLISGYCKARDTKKALAYFGTMLKSGIEPSVTSYTVLVDNYCRSGDMEMAAHVFCEMTEKNLIPDVVLYNTLINGYGKKGQLHKVFELLGMMKYAGVSPDTVTYNIIIHSLITSGFVNEAKDILDELIQRGFSPDKIAFTDVISAFSNRRQFEEAFLLWSYMSKHNIKPDVITCNALLSGYCRAQHMEEARTLFHKLLDLGLIPDLILYNTLIHGFCKIGDISDACYLINMMLKHNIMPNGITFQSLILGYEKMLVNNPVESAASKLQQILVAHGCLDG